MILTYISIMKSVPMLTIKKSRESLIGLLSVMQSTEDKSRESLLLGVVKYNELKASTAGVAIDVSAYVQAIESISLSIAPLMAVDRLSTSADMLSVDESLTELRDISQTADREMREDLRDKSSRESLLSKMDFSLKESARNLNTIVFTKDKVIKNIHIVDECTRIEQFAIEKSMDIKFLLSKSAEEIKEWLDAEGFEIN